MSEQFTEEWIRERNARVFPNKRKVDFDFDIATVADGYIEPPMKESQIEAECTKLLGEDGWRALRTDPVSDRSKGKGFGEVGCADHLFMRPLKGDKSPYACELLWCEFKAGKNRAKSHQIAWHNKERARGFQTWIANQDFPATVQGFKDFYAKSGLKRIR